jgi:hypothetical protein
VRRASRRAQLCAFAFAVAGGAARAAVPDVVGPEAATMHPPKEPVRVGAFKLPASVNRKWLQDDCALIWRVRGALPPDPTAPDRGPAAPDRSVEDTELGLGLRKRTRPLGAGGYFSCASTSVTYEGALLSTRTTCTGYLAKREIRPVIERALGAAFIIDEALLKTTGYLVASALYEVPSAARRARAALDQRLGALAPVDVPPELALAYATLMSPLEELAVGTACSDSGEPPDGAEETKALRVAHRLDLIRNVLRGPNPEARVYAARALERLGPVTPDDKAVIDKVIALPVKVTSCTGCMFSAGSTQDALRALDE